MVQGRLVAVQSIEALRKELMRSARLRITLSKLESQFVEAAERAGAIDVTLEENSLVLTSSAENRLNILRAIEDSGGQIESFATEELSLEDMYMKYVS
jgi:ABC-2 type transport system ATP-binding protein